MKFLKKGIANHFSILALRTIDVGPVILSILWIRIFEVQIVTAQIQTYQPVLVFHVLLKCDFQGLKISHLRNLSTFFH